MEKKLKFKAETLSKAMAKLDQEIPSGFFLVDLQKSKQAELNKKASADTIREAFDKAKKKIPNDAINIKENVVREPKKNIIKIIAFDEEKAQEAAMDKNVEAVNIVKIDMSEKGSRGFLGIGKKPNTYSIELLYQAIVKIDYTTYAEISAEITDDKADANESFLVYSELGNYQFVKYLINQGVDINTRNNDGATALIVSAFNGHPKVSYLLIDNGINIHIQDRGGFNALMVACECDNANIGLIKKLINLGANVNTKSGKDATALMAAAKIGHLHIVKLLISKKADIDAKNADHNITPLIWAANEGHLTIVEFLLKKGADPNIKTFNNYTAASIAAENHHYSIVEILNR